MTCLAAPTGLGATAVSTTQINLSWTAPSGMVTSYNIYRSTQSGNEGNVAIGTTSLTSYSDATANPGTTYYYEVAAVNGTGTGGQSTEASALTAPAVPTNLGATPISATEINLTWSAPSGTVTSYNIYRSTQSGNEGNVAIGTTSLTTYSDATANPGTTYYYEVAAVNGTGTGGQSTEASVLTVPAAPTGLGARAVSTTQINLTWTAPSGTVNGYYVYRGTTPSGRAAPH